jgi:hypothetical protein
MTALEHELRASRCNPRANTDQCPGVGDLRDAGPEAVLLFAVFLELCVLDFVLLRVLLRLILFILPGSMLAKTKLVVCVSR